MDEIKAQFAEIFSLLQNPNKHKLDKAILALANIPASAIKHFCTQENERAKNLCAQFASCIENVLLNGEICEVEYLNLFALLCEANPKPNPAFEVFLQNLSPLLFDPQSSEVENILFLQILSLCKMFASSAREGMEFFIAHVSLIDINVPQRDYLSDFILQRFPKLGVDFALFLQSMQGALKNCLNLSKMRRRSLFNWQLHCFWNVEGYFNNLDWLTLYPAWREVFYALLERTKQALDSKNIANALEWLDEALYVQFFIYHICGNSFHTQAQWRDFNKEIDKEGAKIYALFAPLKSQLLEYTPEIIAQNAQNSAKNQSDSHLPIIAILKDRIVENSPYKVEYSLFKNLLENEAFSKHYRLKIYNMGLLEKSTDAPELVQSLESLGVEVCNIAQIENAKGFYNSHFLKALLLLAQLENDGVKVLLSPNNGYGISDFLLSIRACERQIYYSHGNFVYDIAGIDARATHICNAQKSVVHEGFRFVGIPVKMDSQFYNPPLDEASLRALEVLKAHFPTKRLGTIGRLVKITSKPYLRVVLRLMRESKECVYLACGGGNEKAVRAMIDEGFWELAQAQGENPQAKALRDENLGQELKSLQAHFSFEGFVDSAIYGHLIDVWLDSFPLEQGESRIEYVAKGGIALTLSAENKGIRAKRIESWVDSHRATLEEFLDSTSLDSTFSNFSAQSTQDADFIALPQKPTNTQELQKFLYAGPLVAFSEEEYLTKARAILDASLQVLESLRAYSLQERAIWDFVREKLGVQVFLELIAHKDS
ncbi:hypothetical protein CQA49_04460 [Helicobacter sp. MIT 00-7814]|uniref:hypothetical protein n=1 Tax=Helicobacter sp. MIT 00-7814 TaxID=2040650 RepID=UPI000E1F3BB9|nr:hypothetical protein [Helicobacter sp. MIT 00-7814]RDU54882.1 hypothetical protein CQA49_04460 [Helicobacter sp. MIT 00-7814]